MAKSTKRYSFSPFYFYTLQSFLFFVYAVLTSNTLLKGTTFVGLVFGLYYMTYFYIFAQDKVSTNVVHFSTVESNGRLDRHREPYKLSCWPLSLSVVA